MLVHGILCPFYRVNLVELTFCYNEKGGERVTWESAFAPLVADCPRQKKSGQLLNRLYNFARQNLQPIRELTEHNVFEASSRQRKTLPRLFTFFEIARRGSEEKSARQTPNGDFCMPQS